MCRPGTDKWHSQTPNPPRKETTEVMFVCCKIDPAITCRYCTDQRRKRPILLAAHTVSLREPRGHAALRRLARLRQQSQINNRNTTTRMLFLHSVLCNRRNRGCVVVIVESDTLRAVLVKIWRSVAVVTVEDNEIIGSARSIRCTAN